jgi:hypothetical protein
MGIARGRGISLLPLVIASLVLRVIWLKGVVGEIVELNIEGVFEVVEAHSVCSSRQVVGKCKDGDSKKSTA